MSYESRKMSTLCKIKFKFLLPMRRDLLNLFQIIPRSTIFIHEKFIIYYVIEDIHEPQDNVFP